MYVCMYKAAYTDVSFVIGTSGRQFLNGADRSNVRHCLRFILQAWIYRGGRLCKLTKPGWGGVGGGEGGIDGRFQLSKNWLDKHRELALETARSCLFDCIWQNQSAINTRVCNRIHFERCIYRLTIVSIRIPPVFFLFRRNLFLSFSKKRREFPSILSSLSSLTTGRLAIYSSSLVHFQFPILSTIPLPADKRHPRYRLSPEPPLIPSLPSERRKTRLDISRHLFPRIPPHA